MKDKFFLIIDKINIFIYKTVNGLVYFVFSNKRSKGCKKLSKNEIKEIRSYWNKYLKLTFSLNEFRWFKNRNILNKKIIPESVWHRHIEPGLNNIFLEPGFQDKNYFQFIVGKKNSPETLCRCINNHLLDCEYNPISYDKIIEILQTESEIIVKKSINSSGGKDVVFTTTNDLNVNNIMTFMNMFDGNFIIQKVIKQHNDLSKFNKESVNTLRIVTLFWENKVNYLYGELRFGSKGSRLDNSASGGLWVHVDEFGYVGNQYFSYDKTTTDIKVITPNLKVLERIPEWEDVIDLLTKTHYKLAHFGVVYWDVAISDKGTPIIIEYNLLDSDAYAYQLGVGPIFSDLTDEVLSSIFKH